MDKSHKARAKALSSFVNVSRFQIGVLEFGKCQNEQKQDALFHYFIVRVPLFIDDPDHFPTTWFYSLTCHVDFDRKVEDTRD